MYSNSYVYNYILTVQPFFDKIIIKKFNFTIIEAYIRLSILINHFLRMLLVHKLMMTKWRLCVLYDILFYIYYSLAYMENVVMNIHLFLEIIIYEYK